jgi:NADH-quinone oxidoreductase subunit N
MMPYMNLLPQMLLLLTALLVLLMKIIVGDHRQNFYLAIFGVATSFVASVWIEPGINPPGILVDSFGLLMTQLIVISLLGVMGFSVYYLQREGYPYTEWAVLLVLSGLGLTLMANTHHLLMVFIGLEISSLAFYVLCGYRRDDLRSLEASLKYFVLGSVGSAILLLGIAMIYANQASLLIDQLGTNASTGPFSLWMSTVVVVIGLAFKLSLIPLHFWVPDVYEGAPTPVTAFMSVAVKMGVLAVLIRLLTLHGPGNWVPWSELFWWLALLTMVGGNILALVQESVKRMMAYSSIAHAGYLTLGLTVLSVDGFSAIVFYLSIYLVMNILAFGLIHVAMGEGEYLYDDLRGFSTAQPVLAVCLAVSMISLAGLPPTGGFMGKLMLFYAVVKANYTPLAVVAVLSSLVSVAYYFKVIVYAFMKSNDTDEPNVFDVTSYVPGAVSLAGAAFLIIVGVTPGWLYEPIRLVTGILGGLSL